MEQQTNNQNRHCARARDYLQPFPGHVTLSPRTIPLYSNRPRFFDPCHPSQGATILDRQAVTIGIDDTARGSSRRQRPVLQGLTCGAIVLAEELVAVVARPHEGLDDGVKEEEGAIIRPRMGQILVTLSDPRRDSQQGWVERGSTHNPKILKACTACFSRQWPWKGGEL